ncbi:hypothetical protein BGZ94_005346 [Podila epigama]|nr:hypothetical protein BGZ94_005346 [Podila epigama]
MTEAGVLRDSTLNRTKEEKARTEEKGRLEGKEERVKEHQKKDSSEANKKAIEQGGEDDDEDEDEVEEDDVYEVERVVAHRRDKNGLVYQLKWKNYDESDNTWEHEKSVFCKGLIEEYWKLYEEHGGRRTDSVGHEPRAQTVRRTSINKAHSQTNKGSTITTTSSSRWSQAREKSASAERKIREVTPLGKSQTLSSEPESASNKKQKPSENDNDDYDYDDYDYDNDDYDNDDYDNDDYDNEEPLIKRSKSEPWKPPAEWTTWEEKIEKVITVEKYQEQLFIHLRWKNGRETEHPLSAAHKYCPQTLIRFYESHIRFTQMK